MPKSKSEYVEHTPPRPHSQRADSHRGRQRIQTPALKPRQQPGLRHSWCHPRGAASVQQQAVMNGMGSAFLFLYTSRCGQILHLKNCGIHNPGFLPPHPPQHTNPSSLVLFTVAVFKKVGMTLLEGLDMVWICWKEMWLSRMASALTSSWWRVLSHSCASILCLPIPHSCCGADNKKWCPRLSCFYY
jgi:hypothetical protein